MIRLAYKYEDKINEAFFTASRDGINVNRELLAELQEVYNKAKAFNTFIKYKQHVEKFNNSDCHELERVFEFVMKEYEEDK